MIISVDAEQLAAAVLAEGQRHAPRDAAETCRGRAVRRAHQTSTIDGARRALAGFADEQVQADALELLRRLVVNWPEGRS